MRGHNIKENLRHDAGAYARCSYCGRYSDISGTIYNELKCDCGKTKGWSGSFNAPTENSKWISKETKQCRVCGCTDDKACPGGCHWIEDDLCSQCKS